MLSRLKSRCTIKGSGNQVLLFIHGFLDSKEIWRQLTPELNANQYEKIYMDLPGMGSQSTWTDTINFETITEYSLEIIDTIDKPITIIAHSMGAQVAEIIATKRPTKVKGMVLITPIPIKGLKVHQPINTIMKNASGRKWMHRMMRNTFCKGASNEAIDSMVNNGIKVTNNNVRALFNTWTKGYKNIISPSIINIPILVISGEKDLFSTPKVCKEIIGPHFKDFTYRSISDASHWPHVNRVNEVAKFINAFLEEMGHKTVIKPPNPDHPNAFGNVKNYEWTDAFFEKDLSKFQSIFHKNATQTASTSPYTTHGFGEISDTFRWASAFYKRCDFTNQAQCNNIDFMEFDLTTRNNMHMTGMTVLIKDDNGKVINVFNGHRNLYEVLLFVEHFVKGPKNKGTVSVFHNKALKKYGLSYKFERDNSSILASTLVTEKQYIEAFKLATKEAFEKYLDEEVILSGSYVTKNLHGIDVVSECLSHLATFYEHCIFTKEAKLGNRTYLLYKGRLRNGLNISDGFLILVRNDQGKIIEVLDNPLPLYAGTLISTYIRKNMSNIINVNDCFYNNQSFIKAVKKYGLENVYGKSTKDMSSYKAFIAKFLIKV